MRSPLLPAQAEHDAELAYREALEACTTPEQIKMVHAMQKIVREYIERRLHPRPVRVLRLVNGKPAPDAA